jgi:hypothetical protein
VILLAGRVVIVNGKVKNSIWLNASISRFRMAHWLRALAWYFLSSNLLVYPLNLNPSPESAPPSGQSEESSNRNLPSIQYSTHSARIFCVTIFGLLISLTCTVALSQSNKLLYPFSRVSSRFCTPEITGLAIHRTSSPKTMPMGKPLGMQAQQSLLLAS